MSKAIAEFRARIQRPAVVFEIGGFRPPDDPGASFIGRVNLAAPGEGWPMEQDTPMLPLAQINLTTLPFRPPRLADIEFLTLFISRRELPVDTDNGQQWCLRAYRKLADLVPLTRMVRDSPIKQMGLRAVTVERDYPCWEDVADLCPPELEEDDYPDLFKNVPGFKLGGWPTLVQSEISWAPHHEPAAPEYVFQIDSSEKAHWAWGDGGVGYFGRGTAPGHEDLWSLAWQCF